MSPLVAPTHKMQSAKTGRRHGGPQPQREESPGLGLPAGDVLAEEVGWGLGLQRGGGGAQDQASD